ncbi:hypothetical protein COO60DRAFT_1698849, partial [Scenedesmus sp. NREL 46B-D3]
MLRSTSKGLAPSLGLGWRKYYRANGDLHCCQGRHVAEGSVKVVGECVGVDVVQPQGVCMSRGLLEGNQLLC